MSYKSSNPLRRNYRPVSSAIEQLEVRTLLDCSGVLTGEIEFEESEWVKTNDDSTIRFVSLRVGEAMAAGAPFGELTLLEDDAVVKVGEHDVTMGQVKAYLHGFADSIGTDLIIETQDIRFSTWGTGSGSTSSRFEAYIVEQIENREPCTGLKFVGDVSFNLPGTGGKQFTGGFLDLNKDGTGGLLRGGDIAEVVESYEISSDGTKTKLMVNAQLGEMQFTINADKTLTDKFDRVWTAESDCEIVDPNATDEILGDFDDNGVVDFADFLFLSDNFGSENAEADLDGSGTVDFADFLLLANNFGNEP